MSPSFLSDVLQNPYWSVINANVKSGDTVIVLNCGPVGLMPQKFAWMKNAKRVIAVDYLDYQITYAKKISNAGVFEFRNYPNMGERMWAWMERNHLWSF